MENVAETHEEVGVDIWASEYFIYVAAVAMDLATQPCHCPLLATQFLFNKFSYVYRLVVECFIYIRFHSIAYFFTFANSRHIAILISIANAVNADSQKILQTGRNLC